MGPRLCVFAMMERPSRRLTRWLPVAPVFGIVRVMQPQTFAPAKIQPPLVRTHLVTRPAQPRLPASARRWR